MVNSRRPELDTDNPPGQIVNDITLKDYYERKGYVEPKKLTFDEWSESLNDKIENIDFHWHADVWDLIEAAWKAGQENK